MAPSLPAAARHVVVGGGVHGLSSAWHLARGQRERGEAPDVLVLERDRLGAGASGIAGGIVRNYYRSEAMTEVIAESVAMFEDDPQGYGFHQVGYLAVVPEEQRADLRAIAARQAQVGYESELVDGPQAAVEYLRWLWPDVREDGIAAVLHERRSGWADAAGTVRRLGERAREAGAAIAEGVRVTGLERDGDTVTAVVTDAGAVACETVLAAPGPWAPQWWRMLGRAPVLEVDGVPHPLVAYWLACEGDFVLPGVGLAGRAGRPAPVVHVDRRDRLHSARDGRLLTDEPWGIYFRLGATGTGVVGGGLPLRLPDDLAVEPYGPDNPQQCAGDDFSEFFTSGLAAILGRFGDAGDGWECSPHGGVVSLTPDGYPVADRTGPNSYAILDAGHGFKMLAVGREAAREVLGDGPSRLLEPFRLGRFGAGTTHVASKSPYPWT